MNCQWPKCGCAEREQCKPEDALKAALARAEAAEKARDRYATLYGSAFKALTEAQRQRDEAYALLREWLRDFGDNDDSNSKAMRDKILAALPIPAQEK